jgi:predicted ABC-type ATPase
VKRLYVIAGCNGAGKTTASYNILPDVLDCREFVNADEIAAGLSPFQPEKVSFEAGRIMLERIHNLLEEGETFAFETTLSTRSYLRFIQRAKEQNYQVSCLFLWLKSEELDVSRVKTRVNEGGHNIPEDVIRRRYRRGLENFFTLFLHKFDNWIFADNSRGKSQIIAEGSLSNNTIHDINTWDNLKSKYGKF